MIRRRITTALALLALTLAFRIGVSADAPAAEAGPGGKTTSPVARGEYLVRFGLCNDCHTPHTLGPNGAEPDMTRALSGHPEQLTMPPSPALLDAWVWAGAGTNTAFTGPWGVSFTANLTPDKETGLGEWTADMFIAALRTGRHQGKGRPILPPMPYQYVATLTDEDLRAVFAYLQSIPPVRNRVPAPLDPPETGQ
jgi:mono/diheme cytochrome c family protein